MQRSRSSPDVGGPTDSTGMDDEPMLQTKSSTIKRFTKTMSRLRSKTSSRKMDPVALPNITFEGAYEDINTPGAADDTAAVSTVDQEQEQIIRNVEGMISLESTLAQLHKQLQSSMALADSLHDVEKQLDFNKPPTASPRSGSKPDVTAIEEYFSWISNDQAGIKWKQQLEELDAAIIKQQFADAVTLLQRLQQQPTPTTAGRLQWSLQHELSNRRVQLANAIQRVVDYPAAGDTEVEAAIQVMNTTIGKRAALDSLLQKSSNDLQQRISELIRPTVSAKDYSPVYYAMCLAYELGLCIAKTVALAETVLIHDAMTPWVLEQVEYVAKKLESQALVPCTIPAGLQSTSSCVDAFITTAVGLLPNSYSSLVRSKIIRSLWPCIEGVFSRRCRQIAEGLEHASEQELRVAIDILAQHSSFPTAEGAEWSTLVKILPSADKLVQECEKLAQYLYPVASPAAASALRQGTLKAYHGFTVGIEHAIAACSDKKKAAVVASAELAMEICIVIADTRLPTALAAFGSSFSLPYDEEGLLNELNRLGTALGMAAVE